MAILTDWYNNYWLERGFEASSSLWLRRIRLIGAGVAVLGGIAAMLTLGNWLWLVAGLWLAILCLYPIHGFLLFYCLITLYPVSRALTVSLRPGQNLLSTELDIIPQGATFDNYSKLFTEHNFGLWVWNSLLITVTVSLVGVIISATSAYAFSRWRFPGRSVGLIVLLSTQMIPAGMLLIPIFILVSRLNLQNNILGLALAYVTTAVPLSIWMLRGYYDTIPFDLEEAAMVDGATRMSAFWRVILPLSTPALAVVFLFNFLAAWAEWPVANVILKASDKQTWPLGLNTLIGQFQTNWGVYSAGSVLITIPVVILFLYSSRFLISGLTLGSVKG